MSAESRAKPPLSTFARKLLEWKRLELPKTNAVVVAGVSGGADSVALLLALEELNRAEKLDLKIVVAHLDHKLRKNSGVDARWVAKLARGLGFRSVIRRVNVARKAGRLRQNLEQTGRRARYSFFAELAKKEGAQVVLTAHTMDDQAETLLLNLLRGAGIDGLVGIDPVRELASGSHLQLARPLVTWARRRDTEAYCRARGVEFLIDETNADERFARVRIRRQLLPLMKTFNPKIVESLARIAALAREDRATLERKAGELLQTALSQNGKTEMARRLSIRGLSTSHAGLRRRALREWVRKCRGDLRRLERVHVLAIDSLVFGQRGGRVVELPGGARITRKRELLEYSE
jgi:tRNA(Ile)-lysidine synthase